MRFFYEPLKDTSIYSDFPTRNAGLDEILEVGKRNSGIDFARSLIQFDLSAISASMVDGTIPTSASFDLRLYIARADKLKIQQTLNYIPISASWDEGSGYFYQNINAEYTSSFSPNGLSANDGATWQSRVSGTFWTAAGGDYLSPVLSSSLDNPPVDITLDISNIVRSWLSGSSVLANNGLIIKLPDVDESSSTVYSNIRFFSRNTHTVYSPQLIAKWNDQVFATGSLTASAQTNIVVVPTNLKPKYRQNEYARIDLAVRDRFPIKTFSTQFAINTGQQYLTSTAYYSIVDVQSNAVIVPFDTYSQISCDGTSSYANFKVSGMYPGRFYKLLIKTISGPYQEIHEPNYYFMVEPEYV